MWHTVYEVCVHARYGAVIRHKPFPKMSHYSDAIVRLLFYATWRFQTFPALLDLYRHDFLPTFVTICGYSRSSMSDDDLRSKIKPYLTKKGAEADEVVDSFLERVHYRSGECSLKPVAIA